MFTRGFIANLYFHTTCLSHFRTGELHIIRLEIHTSVPFLWLVAETNEITYS
jgi:hypothetical protein